MNYTEQETNKMIMNEYILRYKARGNGEPTPSQINDFMRDCKVIVNMYLKKGYTIKQAIRNIF